MTLPKRRSASERASYIDGFAAGAQAALNRMSDCDLGLEEALEDARCFVESTLHLMRSTPTPEKERS